MVSFPNEQLESSQVVMWIGDLNVASLFLH